MSMSPGSADGSGKRKRDSYPANGGAGDGTAMAMVQDPHHGNSAVGTVPPTPPAHIPKRGARACTACRRGKNRCEGDAPCRRCQLSGTPCVFEKPEKKNPAVPNNAVERVSRLEGQFLVMQSQMIGMQSSLDRILAAVSAQQGVPGAASELPAHHLPYPHGQAPAGVYSPPFAGPASSSARTTLDPNLYPEPPRDASGNPAAAPNVPGQFPPLPGFAPPPHKFATYGIVPSTAPSSEDESEDTLPRSALTAPIEALQGLANAAAEATAAGPNAGGAATRVKKRKRVEPTPRNAFPSVLDKNLVSEAEARELYHIFFSGCHLFIPLFDPAYDTFESLRDRTPWCFDAVLAVASKVRAGNGPLSPTYHRCLEEAQGIARSTLFGPVVRKEAVQAMLLLAAWSTNGWLPGGHAMRMALDLGLHRALEKLAESASSASPGGNGTAPGRIRSEEEERDLVVSARIWLCLYWFDHQMSLGTGRPLMLRDEATTKHCRVLLRHPMASPTDVRLVSQIELIAQKTQIYETLSPLNGQVNHSTLAFIRRANDALDKWWAECDELHRPDMGEDSLLRKILAGELYYAKLWLVCVALRGVSWDKMPFEQRELAFSAKEAASNCLATFLNSPSYRAALRYAVHDSLVTASFSALFLLKVANLFPGEVDLGGIITQVEQLAQLLSDVAAERYSLTLRLMLANLRRKMGVIQAGPTPITSAPAFDTPDSSSSVQQAPPQPITLENLGFAWPPDILFNPTNIPQWIQEASLTDLGLPINGFEGIFIPMAAGWTGELPMPQAW